MRYRGVRGENAGGKARVSTVQWSILTRVWDQSSGPPPHRYHLLVAVVGVIGGHCDLLQVWSLWVNGER